MLAWNRRRTRIPMMPERISVARDLRAPAGRTPAGRDRRRHLAAARLRGLCVPALGLAARHGISIVNAPGIAVDAGYRGEIKACLLNTDRSQPVSITRGDRIVSR